MCLHIETYVVHILRGHFHRHRLHADKHCRDHRIESCDVRYGEFSVNITDRYLGGAVNHDGGTGERLVLLDIVDNTFYITFNNVDTDIWAFEYDSLINHFIVEKHIDRYDTIKHLLKGQTSVIACHRAFCRLEYIFLIDKLQPGIVLESVDHSLGRGFVE